MRRYNPSKVAVAAVDTVAVNGTFMNEGTQTLDIELPDTWQVERVAAPTPAPLADLHTETLAALARPLASLPLTELSGPGTRVCIAIDGMHGVQRIALRAVIETLVAAGVAASDIVVLSQPQTGKNPAESALPVEQVIHDADDIRQVNDLGIFDGVHLRVNHNAVEADLLIGLSALRLDDLLRDAGSSVTVAFDLGAASTQNELRGTQFIDDRLSPYRESEVRFDRVVREGARRAGLVFAVDMLLDETGAALAVKAGSPAVVNAELTLMAHTLREASASFSADLLVADMGQTDFYAASRAAINIGLASDSALMRGGVMVLPAIEAQEADDAGEVEAFYDALENGDTTEDVIRRLSGRALRPGESRAYMLAHVMQRHPIITVADANEHTPRHVINVRTLTEAAELAETVLGHRPRALVLQRARSALPVVSRFGRSARETDEMVNDLLRDIDL